VAALLRDPARARHRAAPLAAAAPRRLCSPDDAPATAAATAIAPAAAWAPDGEAVPPAEAPRDEELYDDAEFYAQLLKELLESAGDAAGAGAPAPRAKLRRIVERRASKGRKLRFSVIDKLVNFMAPVGLSLPPQADQLLKRLFGGAARPALE
jgi:protein AATF/BFR2